ncbi:MAG: hypothetical protein HY064_16470 [Bacteroidetes bacterium]|nr:hypothetical protein [Bacteroidota bacterium]
MRKFLIAVLLSTSVMANAQTTGFHNGPGGQFGFGVRSTASFFNSTLNSTTNKNNVASGTGTGFGGQFHLRFFRLLNSEWFADYIQSDLGGLGKRTDYHIGWAVMFYPPFYYKDNQLHKLQPYFMAGHCFDYTSFESNLAVIYPSGSSATRWSAAITAGMGCHFPVTDRIDLSASALFMNHLGREVSVELRNDVAHQQDYLYLDTEPTGGTLNGHLLFSVSMNYRVGDLWKKAIKEKHESPEMEDQNKPNPF